MYTEESWREQARRKDGRDNFDWERSYYVELMWTSPSSHSLSGTSPSPTCRESNCVSRPCCDLPQLLLSLSSKSSSLFFPLSLFFSLSSYWIDGKSWIERSRGERREEVVIALFSLIFFYTHLECVDELEQPLVPSSFPVQDLPPHHYISSRPPHLLPSTLPLLPICLPSRNLSESQDACWVLVHSPAAFTLCHLNLFHNVWSFPACFFPLLYSLLHRSVWHQQLTFGIGTSSTTPPSLKLHSTESELPAPHSATLPPSITSLNNAIIRDHSEPPPSLPSTNMTTSPVIPSPPTLLSGNLDTTCCTPSQPRTSPLPFNHSHSYWTSNTTWQHAVRCARACTHDAWRQGRSAQQMNRLFVSLSHACLSRIFTTCYMYQLLLTPV